MNIKLDPNHSHKVRLSELYYGDCFIQGKKIYIKTDVFMSDNHFVCVNLNNGGFLNKDGHDEVERVKATCIYTP